MRISDVTFDIATGEVLNRWNVVEHGGPVALARGGDEKAWNRSQTAKSQAGLTAAGGYGGAATGELGYLDPQFRSIAANPMSAGERAGRLSATGGAFDAMGEKAGERLARTHNSAGYGDILDELARGKSRAIGETASGLDTEAFNRKMEALKGVGGLYGTNVGAQTHLLTPGSPVKEPGFWDSFFGQLLQTGGTLGAAAIGA